MEESGKEVNGNVNDNNKGKSNKKPSTYKGKKFDKKFTGKKLEANDVTERRNKLLIKFFRLIDLPVRLIGDDDKPEMLYNEEVILNATVNNFELNFTDSPTSNNVVYTVKLNENPRFDKNRILQFLTEYKARAIFKVALKTTPKLYLAGYNFLNKEEKLGRYPVFSGYNPKIYFTEEKAKEIVKELISDGYQAVYE
jgi:hypothetical protein